MADLVKLTDLASPENYVRLKGLDAKHLDRLQAAVPDAVSGTARVWPFPPITVWKKKDGKLVVIDGNHRLVVARRTGFAEIPATISEYLGEKEAVIEQVNLNARHGLVLDLDSRDNAIRSLIAGGFTNTQVSAMFGLSLASVGRIATGKQRTGETGKRSTAHKGRKRTGKKGKLSPAEEFWVQVRSIFGLFRSNQNAILVSVARPGYQEAMHMIETIHVKLDEARRTLAEVEAQAGKNK